MVFVVGAGDIEGKLLPTRWFMLVLWEAETGLGAANWVLGMEGAGGSIPRSEVFEGAWVEGVAEIKSSNSSSSAPFGGNSIALVATFLPFVTDGFGGVLGGKSSSPNASKRSTSGSFFFGGSGFLASRLALGGVDVIDEGSAFLRVGAAAPPSSYSSYSSNRSFRPLAPES